MIKGYCVNCGKNQEMKDVEIELTSRGGYIAKGFCSVCNTRMCAMMSKENVEKAIESGEAKKAF